VLISGLVAFRSFETITLHFSFKIRYTNTSPKSIKKRPRFSILPLHDPRRHWNGETPEKQHENSQSTFATNPFASIAEFSAFRPDTL
jgi:hypothetical protein